MYNPNKTDYSLIAEVHYEVKRLFMDNTVEKCQQQLERLEDYIKEHNNQNNNNNSEANKKEDALSRGSVLKVCEEISSLNYICADIIKYENTELNSKNKIANNTNNNNSVDSANKADQATEQHLRTLLHTCRSILLKIENLFLTMETSNNHNNPNAALTEIAQCIYTLQTEYMNDRQLVFNASNHHHNNKISFLVKEVQKCKIFLHKTIKRVFQSIKKGLQYYYTQCTLQTLENNNNNNNDEIKMNYKQDLEEYLMITQIILSSFQNNNNSKNEILFIVFNEDGNKNEKYHNFEAQAEVLFSETENINNNNNENEKVFQSVLEFCEIFQYVQRSHLPVSAKVILMLLNEQIVEEKKFLCEAYFTKNNEKLLSLLLNNNNNNNPKSVSVYIALFLFHLYTMLAEEILTVTPKESSNHNNNNNSINNNNNSELQSIKSLLHYKKSDPYYFQQLIQFCADSKLKNDTSKTKKEFHLKNNNETENTFLKSFFDYVRKNRFEPFISILIVKFTVNPSHIILLYQSCTHHNHNHNNSIFNFLLWQDFLMKTIYAALETVLKSSWKTMNYVLQASIDYWVTLPENNEMKNKNNNKALFLDVLAAYKNQEEQHPSSNTNNNKDYLSLFCRIIQLLSENNNNNIGKEEIITVLRSHTAFSSISLMKNNSNGNKIDVLSSKNIHNNKDEIHHSIREALFSGTLFNSLHETSNAPFISFSLFSTILNDIISVVLDSVLLLNNNNENNENANKIMLNLLQNISKWISESILSINAKTDAIMKKTAEMELSNNAENNNNYNNICLVLLCVSVFKSKQTLFPLLAGIEKMERVFIHENNHHNNHNQMIKESFDKTLQQNKKNALFVMEKAEKLIHSKMILFPFSSAVRRLYVDQTFQLFQYKLSQMNSNSNFTNYYTLLFSEIYPHHNNHNRVVPSIIRKECYDLLFSLQECILFLKHNNDSCVDCRLSISESMNAILYVALTTALSSLMEKDIVPYITTEINKNHNNNNQNFKSGLFYFFVHVFFEVYYMQLLFSSVLQGKNHHNQQTIETLKTKFHYLLENVIFNQINRYAPPNQNNNSMKEEIKRNAETYFNASYLLFGGKSNADLKKDENNNHNPNFSISLPKETPQRFTLLSLVTLNTNLNNNNTIPTNLTANNNNNNNNTVNDVVFVDIVDSHSNNNNTSNHHNSLWGSIWRR